MLAKQAVIAALLNTQKQTQGHCQTKKHGQKGKKKIKTPEKELNKMQISNLSDAEFKALVIRLLRELSEDLSSIETIQSEMKNILI